VLVFFLRIPFVFNAAFMDKKNQLTQMTKMPFSIDCQNEEILKNGFKIKKKNLTKPC